MPGIAGGRTQRIRDSAQGAASEKEAGKAGGNAGLPRGVWLKQGGTRVGRVLYAAEAGRDASDLDRMHGIIVHVGTRWNCIGNAGQVLYMRIGLHRYV